MDGNTTQDLEELTQPLLPGGHDDQFGKWSYCLPIRSYCWKAILPQYLIVACGVPPSAHESQIILKCSVLLRLKRDLRLLRYQ